MDDRHTFSDPRPVAGLDLPTWELDVFRKGVDEPVLTLLIDETTLPPRMRKKKVVWKLPDSIDSMPNFGSDEKRRLLDLFKQQKKERRKSKKVNESDEKEEQAVQNEGRPEESRNEGKSKPPQCREEEIREEDSASLPQRGETATNGGASSAPEVQALADNGGGPTQKDAETLPPLPSNGHSRPSQAPPIPPPGFDVLSLEDNTPPPPAAPPQTAPAPRRFFAVPSDNIPVDLAKCVVDIYYPCITQGHSEELLEHYAPKAQKSLSVGGAHAFCHSPHEFLMQLQSLQGSHWDVRGVVAQQGVCDSVVLLITGTMQNAATRILPFCHTITLIRIDEAYQIHNDAMAILTEGMSL